MYIHDSRSCMVYFYQNLLDKGPERWLSGEEFVLLLRGMQGQYQTQVW